MIVNSSVLLTFFNWCCLSLSSTRLNWLLGCLFGSGDFYRFTIIELNRQNSMTNSTNLIVLEVDLFDYAACCGWNLSDKLISEHFA
jgi:hypothetical protein